MRALGILQVGAIAFISLMLTPSVAHAVLSSCTVSSTAVAFGTYNVFSLTDLLSTGTVTVSSCTGTGSATVTLGKGLHSASFTTRDLLKSGGTDLLNYNLYLDAARAQLWGDGTGGTLTWNPTGNSSHTIFGKVTAGQTSPSTGSYSDTVGVTINF